MAQAAGHGSTAHPVECWYVRDNGPPLLPAGRCLLAAPEYDSGWCPETFSNLSVSGITFESRRLAVSEASEGPDCETSGMTFLPRKLLQEQPVTFFGLQGRKLLRTISRIGCPRFSGGSLRGRRITNMNMPKRIFVYQIDTINGEPAKCV